LFGVRRRYHHQLWVSDHPSSLLSRPISLTSSFISSTDKEIKLVLEKRGYTFRTDTDTEAVAVLAKYVYDSQPIKRLNFTELIKAVIKELVRWLLWLPSLRITVNGR
jgi:glucosamine 6-phosphate synthetase-like amidotransferase/phosphosugar isomerase protein